MKPQPGPHHLLILSQHDETYEQLIQEAHLLGLSILAMQDPEEATRQGDSCDILFGEPSLVSKVLNSLPNIKWVQATWAGVDPLLANGMRRDYILTNARNVYGGMVSEYVFSYLLMIERRILSRWQAQMRGLWDDSPHGNLKSKLIGLLGVGTIGAHVAKTARCFGMRVWGYTRRSEACPEVELYFHGKEIRRFVAELDYLVCTLPGTKATRGLVDAALLSAMQDKAWLFNVGRGSVVNEADLVNALNGGVIAGAVLDVFVEEPLPPAHPLWHTPNTFITCHSAARNHPPDIAQLFIENYARWQQGKALFHRVDFAEGY